MNPSSALLVENFDRFLAAFEKYCPFKRPEQIEGHRSTIMRRRQLGSAVAAIHDQQFVDDLYRTLGAWGIGSRASRLVPLNAFGAALRAVEASIASLESRTLEEASRDPQALAYLWSLISSLAIVENDARLVAGTKALHHILPDLVVPMDRAYPQVFFGWQNPKFQYGQHDCFRDAHEVFGEVARAIDLSRYVGRSSWSTSRMKVVDNAVVGAICSLKEGAD